MYKHNNFINLQLHAPECGPGYILDNDGTIVYQIEMLNGDYPSTVALNGNIVTITGSNRPEPVSGASPTINTVGITMTSSSTETTITLPFAPTKIRFNSGTASSSFDNTTNYIDVEQGQSVTTEFEAGFLTGNGILLQYFGTGGGGSMTKQVDLTTLTGWANLSDGEHTITIKAKADGYRDSQASSGVQVTKGSTGETWVLNETPSWTSAKTFSDISFVSNGTSYTDITTSYDSTPMGAERTMLYGTGGVHTTVYDGVIGGEGWKSDTYRTITFATAPTGDLLTWLQANGTKQGGE